MNRATKEKDLTRNIAVYASKHGSLSVNDIRNWIEEGSDYVRVSEPMEVVFTALSDEVVLGARVQQIDGEIEKTRAELTRRINDLTDQRQRLLAITHEEQS